MLLGFPPGYLPPGECGGFSAVSAYFLTVSASTGSRRSSKTFSRPLLIRLLSLVRLFAPFPHSVCSLVRLLAPFARPFVRSVYSFRLFSPFTPSVYSFRLLARLLAPFVRSV